MNVGPNSAGTLLPGDLVKGRYRIRRALGSGGAACVYEAIQLSTDRTVALKVYGGPPDVADRAARTEASYLARVEHENAVVLFDRDTDPDGRSFLVLEFVHGQSLDVALQQTRPLPVADAMTVLAQLADFLAAAHRIGLVHGDIKPANIILKQGSHGVRIKVLDFGTAQMVGEDEGTGAGTWNYMSPEQVEGAPVTPGADVFAAGVLLHEMLSGEPRYASASDRFDPHKRRAALLLPGALGSGPLGDLLAWSTHPDPALRCPDGAALRTAVAGLVDLRATPGASRAKHLARIAAQGFYAPPSSSSLLEVVRGLDTRWRGRGPERRLLLETLANLRSSGQPATVILGGELGIGKGALVRWLLAEAQSAATGAFGAVAHVYGARWALRVLAAVATGQAKAPVQELLTAVDNACGGLRADETQAVLTAAGYMVGRAPDPALIARIIARAVTDPTLLVFSEIGMHKGIPAFIEALTRRLASRPRPIFTVATLDRERLVASPRLRKFMASVARLPHVQVRQIGPLGADEVIEFARDVLGGLGYTADELETPLGSAIVHAAAGNPGAVADVCRHLHSLGALRSHGDVLGLIPLPSPTPLVAPRMSRALRASLDRRLDGLDNADDLLLLVRRAALVGPTIERDLLVELLRAESAAGHECAGRLLEDLDAKMDQLVLLDVLVPVPGRAAWVFAQRLMQRAVDAANDTMRDGPLAHRLAAHTKTAWFEGRGEPPWRYKEIEAHEARADITPTTATMLEWSAHDTCWS